MFRSNVSLLLLATDQSLGRDSEIEGFCGKWGKAGMERRSWIKKKKLQPSVSQSQGSLDWDNPLALSQMKSGKTSFIFPCLPEMGLWLFPKRVASLSKVTCNDVGTSSEVELWAGISQYSQLLWVGCLDPEHKSGLSHDLLHLFTFFLFHNLVNHLTTWERPWAGIHTHSFCLFFFDWGKGIGEKQNISLQNSGPLSCGLL